MVLAVAADPVPIRINSDGVALVGNTRVPLETVVLVFQQGAAPEMIVERFPTLRLPDVYAVVAYYLRHTEDVEAYLRERQLVAAKVRTENERRTPTYALRERLNQRRANT